MQIFDLISTPLGAIASILTIILTPIGIYLQVRNKEKSYNRNAIREIKRKRNLKGRYRSRCIEYSYMKDRHIQHVFHPYIQSLSQHDFLAEGPLLITNKQTWLTKLLTISYGSSKYRDTFEMVLEDEKNHKLLDKVLNWLRLVFKGSIRKSLFIELAEEILNEKKGSYSKIEIEHLMERLNEDLINSNMLLVIQEQDLLNSKEFDSLDYICTRINNLIVISDNYSIARKLSITHKSISFDYGTFLYFLPDLMPWVLSHKTREYIREYKYFDYLLNAVLKSLSDPISYELFCLWNFADREVINSLMNSFRNHHERKVDKYQLPKDIKGLKKNHISKKYDELQTNQKRLIDILLFIRTPISIELLKEILDGIEDVDYMLDDLLNSGIILKSPSIVKFSALPEIMSAACLNFDFGMEYAGIPNEQLHLIPPSEFPKSGIHPFFYVTISNGMLNKESVYIPSGYTPAFSHSITNIPSQLIQFENKYSQDQPKDDKEKSILLILLRFIKSLYGEPVDTNSLQIEFNSLAANSKSEQDYYSAIFRTDFEKIASFDLESFTYTVATLQQGETLNFQISNIISNDSRYNIEARVNYEQYKKF